MPALGPATTASWFDRRFPGRPIDTGSVWNWLLIGARRYVGVAVVALLIGSPFSFLALWLLPVAVVLGGVLGASYGGTLGAILGAALACVLVVALAAFGIVVLPIYWLGSRYGFSYLAASLIGLVGLVVSLVGCLLLSVLVEPVRLHLRGYRRMSARERQKVEPILEEVRARMGLTSMPRVLVHDREGEKNAITFTRSVVLYSSLGLHAERDDADDEELRAVVAHELQHWAAAHVVGQAFLMVCFLPIVLILDLGVFLVRGRGLVALLGYVLAWPAWVSSRFIVGPLLSRVSVAQEYEADAAAVRAGYGPALCRYFEFQQRIEPAETGWDAELDRTHPPTELRIEAARAGMLQQAHPGS